MKGLRLQIAFGTSTKRYFTALKTLRFRDAKAHMKLFVEQAATWLVGLEPFSIDHQLRNGALADMANNLSRGRRIGIHIDFGVFNPVVIEKLFGRPAISAPCGGINLHLHTPILLPIG